MPPPKHIYLTMIILLWSLVLFAQNPHPPWRNYTTDDGLPSSEVHYCLETTDGYIWFATDNGLSRFDGYEFKNYGIKEGLGDPVIFYMQLDPEGKLWMATMSAELFYMEDDRIYPFEHNPVIEVIKDSLKASINDFYIDESGRKFIGLSGAGVLEFNQKRDHILHAHSHPFSNRIALKFGERWMMASIRVQDSLKKILLEEKFYSRGEMPPILMIADSTYELSGLKFSNISSPYWIKEFSDGRTFIYQYKYLYEVAGNDILWNKKVPYELESKMIYETASGPIYIGMKEKGLRLYENLDAWKNEEFDQYLPGKSISHIFKDRVDNFWVTTTDAGVFFCSNLDWEIYDQAAGLSNDFVASIAIKNDDELYIGLRNREIYHLDAKTESLNLIPPISVEVAEIIYDMIYYPPQKELWIGIGRHAYFKDGKWDQVIYVRENGRSQLVVIGKNLTLRKGGHRIWGGGNNRFGGIDISKKEVILYSPGINISGRTLAVWESSDNTLWVGNTEGLFVLKDMLLIPPTPFNPAFQTRVEDIAEMSDSTLVVGTKGQGVLLKKGDFFHQIDSKDGLTTDMIENVYVDEWDNIWVGTLNGLNKISGFQWQWDTSFSVRQFTTQNGLPSNEINKVEASGNDVWIATTKGLIHLKDNSSVDSISASPIISNVSINGSPLDTFENTNFSYDQNDIVFQYLTINFRQDGHIPYRYRLVPVQKGWAKTLERTVNFSSLKSGNYTFEVQSQNEDGIPSPTTTFSFTIHPPFWKAWWFIILFAAILGLIVYRFYKYRTNQIRHEAQLVKQMAELERSALRAQMNPHFIFNCLSSISNFINKGDKVASNYYLATFAKLIRAALNHSRKELVSLEDELQLLENYMDLEQLRFNNRFEYNIELGEGVEPFEIEIPPMMIQPFLENAIIHGLADKEEKGRIDLFCELQNGQLIITITDNGVGIEQSKKQKAVGNSLHKSVGMTITQKRLELININNEINVKELKRANGNVSGTQVTLKIKLE